MSRSREEGRGLPSSCRGCRDRQRRENPLLMSRRECREQGGGESSPLIALWMSRTRRRGELFSPPRAADVEIERGGENPLLTPWMSRTRRGGESSPLLAPWMSRSREEEFPSLRRGCRKREMRRGLIPPHTVVNCSCCRHCVVVVSWVE